MIYIVVLGIVVVMVAAAIFVSGRGFATGIGDVREIAARTRPVDIQAFRQLQDPEDVAFLRSHLDRHAFRRVQRERARAMVDYLRAIFHNCAVLVRVGDLARRSGHSDLVLAGTKLSNAAVQVRVHATMALARASLEAMWPGRVPAIGDLIGDYERVRQQFTAVALMQCPAESSRLAAAL